LNILEAYDLYRFYHTEDEETLALRGVSLTAKEGELLAVMGPSGSGKSTLLSCLCGIDEPDGGYVVINGKQITRKSETARAAIRAAEIGIVMQSKNLLNHMSIKDNIRMKMWLNHKVDISKINELLELVDLKDKSSALPAQISGGEAARAAIAVALATNPKILIADEPTGEVDYQTELKILQLFGDFCSKGGTAIIATHSEKLASFANCVLKLYDGRIISNA
jgi:putative ABC transport system ATP-binding protein